jgi:hypothetical protein
VREHSHPTGGRLLFKQQKEKQAPAYFRSNLRDFPAMIATTFQKISSRFLVKNTCQYFLKGGCGIVT